MNSSRAEQRFAFAHWWSTRALFIVLLSPLLFAQHNVNDTRPLQDFSVTYETAPGTGVLIFRIASERSNVHLDRKALLKLVNLSEQSATWQTTDDTSQGVFTNVPYGSYAVEASAVGYLSTTKEVQVRSALGPSEIEIILRRDPSALNLDVANAIMSPKARKDAKKAISFLKSGNLHGAQKQLEEAYKLTPSSPDLNFLLGYLHFQANDFVPAARYLEVATNLNPQNAQAWILLGRNEIERQDYLAARSALEQAIRFDADNWIPYDLLACTYVQEQKYDKAREQAQIALDKGKSHAGLARMTLGEAFVGLGQDERGIQELSTFLKEYPRHPMADRVRDLIAELKEHPAVPTVSTQSSVAYVSKIDPLAAVPVPTLSVKAWQPPGVDEAKPAVASSASCPLSQVLDESGRSTEEFVADVARFAAIEDLFHQVLDSYGIPSRTETRKYNYVATISEREPGFLSVDEFREERLTPRGYPDQIASTGFAALALVFHPHVRDGFEMTCEGLGDWKGNPTWLVHFRQRPDRPNRMHAYNVGNLSYPVGLNGRAWITADKFQIVRIEAEMVKPMPEIQLLSEHQIVEYGPVPFPKKNTALWLPKTAEIYFDFRKHHYYRRHSFDHYMLFAVDTEEKRKEPVAKPNPVGEARPPQGPDRISNLK